VRTEVRQSGRLVAGLGEADDPAGPQSATWDGSTAEGRVRDGRYALVVTVLSPQGPLAHSALFRVDTVAPRLRALSFRRLAFRISEAARVRAVVNGRVSARSVRAGAFSLPFRGRVRRVTITATDAAGNVSRALRFR
jgi:hypothetical protein